VEDGIALGLRAATLANREVFARTAGGILAAQGVTRTGQVTMPALMATIRGYAGRRHPTMDWKAEKSRW